MADISKTSNPYQPVIQKISGLYASGDFSAADNFVARCLMNDEERIQIAPEQQITFLQQKLSRVRRFDPLWKLIDAYKSHQKYTELGLLSGYSAKDIAEKFSSVSEYINKDDFKKLSPEVKNGIFKHEPNQPQKSTLTENLRKKFKIADKLSQDYNLSKEYRESLKSYSKGLAFGLYSQLHKECSTAEISSDQRINNLEEMIELVNKINWKNLVKYETKSWLFGTLSRLYYKNGDQNKGKKARDEYLRFSEAKVNLDKQLIKMQMHKENEWMH